MNPEQWKQVNALFKEVVDLEPDLRTERLESVKTENPLLYEELLSLLEADSVETSLLDGFAVEQVDLSGLDLLERVQVGPFQIEKQIGSGGMGNVYLAHRTKGGFEQTVALKLTKYGMGSEPAISRFKAERSILARLQHPNIARLIDGGITDDDRPWFAMEYVDGETIVSYCRRLNLPVKERLKLFLDITEAVQHAHKNLVIHRDLKPGNIMVTTDGEKPRIKLLDFGISHILEDSDSQQPGLKAMTIAYASPEQLKGEPTSTATDIYSLGVVLHELITGCRPNEEDTPEPLQRELKAICDKAMHPDQAKRFENASDLGDEIRAWLAKRPVPSYSSKPVYRLNKWINRNLAASFTAIFALFTIIILVFVYTQELKRETERAQNEALRAKQIASVLGSSLRAIDPMQNRGEELTARGMVDMSTSYINNQLKNDPGTRAELLLVMANIYANLFAHDVADSISLVAEKLYFETQDTTSYAYISLLSNRSILLEKAGKHDEGLALMYHSLDLANHYLHPGTLEFAVINLDYTYFLDANREFTKVDSILTMIRPIFEQNREAAGESYDDFIFYLGTNYRRTGKFEKAEKYLFESLELSRARYPGIHENIAANLNHISSLYQNMGDFGKALPFAMEAHEMRLEIFGPGHLNTMAAHANTARTYLGAGQFEEAAETYRDVLALFIEEYGYDNFYISGLLSNKGQVYLGLEDYERGESFMRESLEHSERLLPGGHLRHAGPLRGLADALRRQNRFMEALAYIERAYEIQSSLSEDDTALNMTRFILGLCLWNLDRHDEAEPHLRGALANFQAWPERFQPQIDELQALGF